MRQSLYLPTYLSISVCQLLYIPTYTAMSIYVFISLLLFILVYISVYLHQSNLTTYHPTLSIYLSVYLPTHPSFCQTFPPSSSSRICLSLSFQAREAASTRLSGCSSRDAPPLSTHTLSIQGRISKHMNTAAEYIH